MSAKVGREDIFKPTILLDLLADSHNILSSWNNYFPQLLNVHNIGDVREIQLHTADPVPGPIPFEAALIPTFKGLVIGYEDDDDDDDDNL
jgi:hypothetical protein